MLFGLDVKTVREISKKCGVKAKDCLPDMRALRAERLAGLRSAVLNAYSTGSCIYSAAYTWGYDLDSADQIVQEFGNEPAVSENGNAAEVSANAPIARTVPIGLLLAHLARLASQSSPDR